MVDTILATSTLKFYTKNLGSSLPPSDLPKPPLLIKPRLFVVWCLITSPVVPGWVVTVSISLFVWVIRVIPISDRPWLLVPNPFRFVIRSVWVNRPRGRPQLVVLDYDLWLMPALDVDPSNRWVLYQVLLQLLRSNGTSRFEPLSERQNGPIIHDRGQVHSLNLKPWHELPKHLIISLLEFK